MAYSMVPLLALVETEEGHVIVDLAVDEDVVDEEPKNGSFLPH